MRSFLLFFISAVLVHAKQDEFEIIHLEAVTNKTTDLPPMEQFKASPALFIVGCISMFFLILVSNAGGLSGAGSIIPIMLVCFSMTMTQAVPISAFVACITTLLRFVMNFNQMHPQNKDKLALNYDIVQLVMPSVFLGSMIGV